MQKIVFLFVLAVICLSCEAKYFATNCELVRELRKHFPEDQLASWVCIIRHESYRNTRKVSPVQVNGSRSHGMFQINDRYWCNNGSTPGGTCNVTCADVMLDDITKAADCAKIIYNAVGFDGWWGWHNHCDGLPLPDISMC